MDIELINISKKYKDSTVFNNYSYTFKENHITFIMGQSGCGKTTLLRVLMGLESYIGEIKGLENKRISAVFQENRLCENLTIKTNIKLVCDKSDSVIEKYLEKVDLKGQLNKSVQELSGGMKRRVAILRALLYDFDLLILDEPFKGLDMDTKEKVINLLKEKIKGKTVLIVSHDINEMKYFEEENLILHDLS